jgi:hypothetical protein
MAMEALPHPEHEVEPPASETAAVAVELPDKPSPAEVRARWLLIGGLVFAGVLLLGLVVLLVLLSMDAYHAACAGEGPSPGAVVVGLLRDAAIIFVAFETLLIGVLLILLMLQVQSLVVLLRDEIKPMLEAANETLATVRGTTQFVSHNVVSPVVKWSGYLAGMQRILREIGGLREDIEEE